MAPGRISRHRRGDRLERHRHVEGYLAVVLAGGFVEAGDSGRARLTPGDVVVHGAFDAHGDAFGSAGAVVLNLPLPPALTARFGRIANPDEAARLAETDPRAASEYVSAALQRAEPRLDDWPDRLAAILGGPRDLLLGEWADSMGLSPASVSRGFARAYGVSPQRYRAELRARRAAEAVAASPAPLAIMAQDLGFADQAHMSRAVSWLTGLSPLRWRAKCVQERRVATS